MGRRRRAFFQLVQGLFGTVTGLRKKGKAVVGWALALGVVSVGVSDKVREFVLAHPSEIGMGVLVVVVLAYAYGLVYRLDELSTVTLKDVEVRADYVPEMRNMKGEVHARDVLRLRYSYALVNTGGDTGHPCPSVDFLVRKPGSRKLSKPEDLKKYGGVSVIGLDRRRREGFISESEEYLLLASQTSRLEGILEIKFKALVETARDSKLYLRLTCPVVGQEPEIATAEIEFDTSQLPPKPSPGPPSSKA